MSWVLEQGDCLERLREMADHSVDSIVSDPPAGIFFMNRAWDSDKGGREEWVEWLTRVMREAFRVLKPGGHAAIWAFPRTSHWTAWAVENAGFEIREIIHHHHGSGFPKSADISKAIDKLAGAEREVVGKGHHGRSAGHGVSGDFGHTVDYFDCKDGLLVTAPATDAAKQWSGWGTALKPSTEHWILARKPLAEKSIARQVLANGCGALNIDACRVSMTEGDGEARAKTRSAWSKSMEAGTVGNAGQHVSLAAAITGDSRLGSPLPPLPEGRFPPNLLLSHSVECGEECVEGCPVAELDRQSGTSKSRQGKPRSSKQPGEGWGMTHTGQEHNDSGGPSRYFTTLPAALFKFQAKPARREKELGCEHLPDRVLNRVNSGGLENEARFAPIAVKNNHPTTKSIKLMEWLIRLTTRPGGKVLDMFAGSGTTGCAAVKNGFDFHGIEADPGYVEIATARLTYWEAAAGGQQSLFTEDEL